MSDDCSPFAGPNTKPESDSLGGLLYLLARAERQRNEAVELLKGYIATYPNNRRADTARAFLAQLDKEKS